MTSGYYKSGDKMCDIISDEHRLLQAMSRFCIPLGVGDRTVNEVCEENGVDVNTFLAVANYIKFGDESADRSLGSVSIPALMSYLKNAHDYFLNFQLPRIRRKLIEAVDCSMKNEVAFLILKFYDEYTNEVRKHMEFENNKIFTYVNNLLEGHGSASRPVEQFLRGHSAIELKLRELKSLLIKYNVPSENVNLLNDVLFDIYTCENDLDTHCKLENALFVPTLRKLESTVLKSVNTKAAPETERIQPREVISEREREILACAVKGMTNKEIADHLFISINTVLTHRKNISRKLNIHSIAGLTIYAIVNKLVNLEDVKIN